MVDGQAQVAPVVIQGGMGVNVSSWQLARAVAAAGQLGVVSGTGADAILARGLQDGDPGGHLRRALAEFPDQEMAQRTLRRYFLEGGRAPGKAYRPHAQLTVSPRATVIELMVLSNFAQVWLAKEGHPGQVGINLLEKIQMATPWTLVGAMLAGVDVVLMGAGIPREIPRLLDDLATGAEGSVEVTVHGGTHPVRATADPRALLGDLLPPLRRPQFLAIVSLHHLASYLHRDPAIRPDGFVVEGPVAGGHSTPPRGRLKLDDNGQPIYDAKDLADLEAMSAIGLPYWLAGAYATPERLAEALGAGAAGIQCGTIFALSEESGFAQGLRRDTLAALADDTLVVRNDPLASPTGFPFKVGALAGTLADPQRYAARERICDLSYLRVPFERPDGSLGYRCAAEPVDAYIRKGGTVEDTVGRACLCNALTAAAGFGQTRDGGREIPLLTLGQDLDAALRLQELHPEGWTADEAVRWLLSRTPVTAPA